MRRRDQCSPLGHMVLFSLVTVLFFLWGMSNNLTDILVQQFKKSFELSQFSAQLVQTANFLGYFFMAMPAALLMRKWGYKAGMVTGLCLFGGGMVLFWPAAVSHQYVPFLVALFTVGSGASFLETAANPFIAQFGDPATSEQRLNFSQSFNPPGTIVGVLIGARFIFSGVEKNAPEIAQMSEAGTYQAYLHTEIMRVVPTYLAFGAVVLLCAFILSRMTFPSMHSEHEGEAGDHGSFRQLFNYPHLWFAVLANFCNVGAQISSWSSLIPYMKQYTSVTERHAAYYLTGVLVALAVGRFVSTPLMKYVVAEPDAGRLRGGECAADGDGGFAARNCGRVGGGCERFLPVDHVPDDLCAGAEGAGAEYEAGGVVAGDGDCGWGDLSAGAWVYCEDDGKPGEGVYCAAAWVYCCGAVWVSGAAGAAEGCGCCSAGHLR